MFSERGNGVPAGRILNTTTTHGERVVSRNAGFIRQRCEPHGTLPSKIRRSGGGVEMRPFPPLPHDFPRNAPMENNKSR